MSLNEQYISFAKSVALQTTDVHKAEVKSTPKATQYSDSQDMPKKICTSPEIQQKLVQPIIKKWKEDGTYSQYEYEDSLYMELHQ